MRSRLAAVLRKKLIWVATASNTDVSYLSGNMTANHDDLHEYEAQYFGFSPEGFTDTGMLINFL